MRNPYDDDRPEVASPPADESPLALTLALSRMEKKLDAIDQAYAAGDIDSGLRDVLRKQAAQEVG